VYAEVEAFCEKHILPRKTRYNLMVAIDELLEIYKPDIREAPLDFGVAYSEKTDALEVTLERSGEWPQPLESNPRPDDIGLRLLRGVTETIDYSTSGGKSRLVVRIAKSQAIGKS
jgi:polar amino acid transport system ATP-binding protein